MGVLRRELGWRILDGEEGGRGLGWNVWHGRRGRLGGSFKRKV